MSDFNDSASTPQANSDDFQKLVDFFAQGRHDVQARPIPDELLDITVVLPTIGESAQGTHIMCVDIDTILNSAHTSSNGRPNRANTFDGRGTPPSQQIAIAFGDEREMKAKQELPLELGSLNLDFESFIATCNASNMGMGLVDGERILVTEPARVKEFFEATFNPPQPLAGRDF